jgi:hypothetical protein
MVAVSVGVLIGALAGLYLRVFALIPLTILLLLGTAVVDAAHGVRPVTVLVHMADIWVSLTFAYLVSSFLANLSQREASESTERENAPKALTAAIRTRPASTRYRRCTKPWRSRVPAGSM